MGLESTQWMVGEIDSREGPGNLAGRNPGEGIKEMPNLSDSLLRHRLFSVWMGRMRFPDLLHAVSLGKLSETFNTEKERMGRASPYFANPGPDGRGNEDRTEGVFVFRPFSFHRRPSRGEPFSPPFSIPSIAEQACSGNCQDGEG